MRVLWQLKTETKISKHTYLKNIHLIKTHTNKTNKKHTL